MSHEAARARLGASLASVRESADARDLEIAELKAQLDDTRQALRSRDRPRQFNHRSRAPLKDRVWEVFWTCVAGLVLWAVVSKGIAW